VTCNQRSHGGSNNIAPLWRNINNSNNTPGVSIKPNKGVLVQRGEANSSSDILGTNLKSLAINLVVQQSPLVQQTFTTSHPNNNNCV
jgi:hypothetical protein